MKSILVTGHCGLIGRSLLPMIEGMGYIVKGLDLADNSGDICNDQQLENALQGCVGVIHLAAVSRVIWGQQRPDLCWLTNAIASENLLKIALKIPQKPWVLLASSREVYGQPKKLPASECSFLNPLNIYGKSKVYMEEIALKSRDYGLNTAIVRLANVYGCTKDHSDRVIPAFCFNAANQLDLRVDGKNNLFDFTHVSDVAFGLKLIVEQLEQNEKNLPTVHLLPGIGTTLLEAANIAIGAVNSRSSIIEAPSREYDVSHFLGNPELARKLLGWTAKIAPEAGIKKLANAFQELQSRELNS